MSMTMKGIAGWPSFFTLLSITVVVAFSGSCFFYPGRALAGENALNCPELLKDWQGKTLYPREWGERLKGIEFELPVKSIRLQNIRPDTLAALRSPLNLGSCLSTKQPSESSVKYPTVDSSGAFDEHHLEQNSAQPSEYPVVALTLDACSGLRGGNCDTSILDLLENRSIPATIFVTPAWIKRNPDCFSRIVKNPLFELASHGLRHLPASVNGKEVYGIKGTTSPAELCEEVVSSARIIEKLAEEVGTPFNAAGNDTAAASFSDTSPDGAAWSDGHDRLGGTSRLVDSSGLKPMRIRWFRTGTAFYDELAVSFIRRAGFRIAGYSITLDQGATLGKNEVAKRVLQARGGDILLAHMHRPKSGTGAGLVEALPKLLEKGFVFVRLSDLPRE